MLAFPSFPEQRSTSSVGVCLRAAMSSCVELGWGADWDDSLGFQRSYEDERHLHRGAEGATVAASNLLCSLLTVSNTLLILLNILNKKLEFCLG